MAARPIILYVRIVSCHDLEKTDWLSENDTYVETSFKNFLSKTSVVKNNSSPSWADEVSIFPFVMEDNGMHEKIKFVIKDKDLLKDTVLDTISYSLGDLSRKKLNIVRLDHLTFEACIGDFVLHPVDKMPRSYIKLYTSCKDKQVFR